MGRRIENATEFCAVTRKQKNRDVAAHQRVFLQGKKKEQETGLQ
jgi:hypothetical protein